jgi:hypothetical protein
MKPATRLPAAAVAFTILCIPAAGNSDAEWTQLCEHLDACQAQLQSTITEARDKGLSTAYASVSGHVTSVFQVAAQSDRATFTDIITRQESPARLVMDPCAVRAILHRDLKG